jgi:class II lanthipeptide synthase
VSGSRDDLLEAAVRIGAGLCRDALWAGERCNWIGAALEPVDGRWRLVERSFGPALYDGTAGIGLFLLRLFRRTGERPFAAAALGALAQAASRTAAVPVANRASFYTGWTGIAAVLLEAAEALGREDLGSAGRSLLAAVAAADPEEAAIDLVGGSASAVPALLALARRQGEVELHTAAARHGERLLAVARRGESGWSWRTGVEERPDLCGLAHGAAGIAAALLELWAATGEARFLEGAQEGFRYERSRFDAARGNWPDLRRPPGEDAAYRADWCHGAAGIGLARLRARQLLGDGACADEIAAAVAATLKALPEESAVGEGDFSLCHGIAGRLELLLAAGLRERAERLARAATARFHGGDEPWPCGVRGGDETPGLMLGLAGIGHLFLRLHDPEATPPVLWPGGGI